MSCSYSKLCLGHYVAPVGLHVGQAVTAQTLPLSTTCSGPPPMPMVTRLSFFPFCNASDGGGRRVLVEQASMLWDLISYPILLRRGRAACRISNCGADCFLTEAGQHCAVLTGGSWCSHLPGERNMTFCVNVQMDGAMLTSGRSGI